VEYEQAFLEDVIAHPADDAPRLVYADWLEEHGDEKGLARAELIRVQCELAKLPEGEPRREKLAKRERALLKKYGKRWAGPLGKVTEKWAFRRGFVEAIAVDYFELPQFLASFHEVFAAVPIRALRLADIDLEPDFLGTLESYLPRLRSLDLRLANFEHKELRWLLRNPSLASLRALALDIEFTDQVEGPILQTIGKAPNLGGLTGLKLQVGENAGDLEEPVVRALLRSPYLKKVTRLFLPLCRMSRATARALARGPDRAPLTHLALDDANLDEAVIEELLSGPNLARLQYLNVAGAYVGHMDIEEHPALAALYQRFGAAVCTNKEAPYPPLDDWALVD
jgi:uncharacterized protein (TIGR02996 family)